MLTESSPIFAREREAINMGKLKDSSTVLSGLFKTLPLWNNKYPGILSIVQMKRIIIMFLSDLK